MKINPRATKKVIAALDNLIASYQALTFAELQQTEYKGFRALRRLTGFGSLDQCLLCQAADYWKHRGDNCRLCVHGPLPHHCTKHATYKAVEKAASNTVVLAAIKKRVLYLQKLLNAYYKAKK